MEAATAVPDDRFPKEQRFAAEELTEYRDTFLLDFLAVATDRGNCRACCFLADAYRCGFRPSCHHSSVHRGATARPRRGRICRDPSLQGRDESPSSPSWDRAGGSSGQRRWSRGKALLVARASFWHHFGQRLHILSGQSAIRNARWMASLSEPVVGEFWAKPICDKRKRLLSRTHEFGELMGLLKSGSFHSLICQWANASHR